MPAARPAARDPAAVRAPVAGRAGPRVRQPPWPAHRAGHQRGRDLAHRARHPLRDRQRPGARQTLQLPQQGRAAAGRAHQPGGGQPARRALRPRGQRHLHPPVRREGLRRRPRFTDPGDPALVAGRRDPAHEVAAPGRRSSSFRSSSRPAPRPSPTAMRCWASSGRWTTTTSSRPSGRELARLPLDPRVGRMILEARAAIAARGADHRQRAERAGMCDRPLERAAAGRRRKHKSSTTRSRSSWAT